MPHGGYREPENPAAASGPGRFSQRTDTQAGRLSGLPFGTGEAANARLRQARQRGNGQQVPEARPQGQQGLSPAPGPGGLPNVFGAPTSRPDEPITAGSPDAPSILPDDPYTFLRSLYREHPHPDVLRLLRRANAAQQQRQPPRPPPPIQGPTAAQGSPGRRPQRPLR